MSSTYQGNRSFVGAQDVLELCCSHPRAAEAKARMASDADDPNIFELPSDTEAALALLAAQAPPASRICGRNPVASQHYLYTIVKDGTDVDREIERLRLAHRVHVLLIPTPRGTEHVLVRTEHYAAALREAGFDELAVCVASCAGLTVAMEELIASTGMAVSTLEGMAARALQAGWLAPAASSVLAQAQGPEEAPSAQSGEGKWGWALPQAGRLMVMQLRCREEALRFLWKQKFHRSPRLAVERHAAVKRVITQSQLDFQFVLRDLLGKQLVSEQRVGAGGASVLQLTPAGEQVAHTVNLQTGGRNAKRRR